MTFIRAFNSQAVPGPGKYEIKSQFSAKPQPISQPDEPIIHPPFGTQSRVRNQIILTLNLSPLYPHANSLW